MISLIFGVDAEITGENNTTTMMLENTTAAIALENTTPAITLENTTAEITLENTTAASTLENTTASIVLENTTATITLENTTATIMLENTTAAITLENTTAATAATIQPDTNENTTEKGGHEESHANSTTTVILSLVITVLLAVMMMAVCTRKKLLTTLFEKDIVKSIPPETQYRVIHKTERMVETLSNWTLQEDKSQEEFRTLETLTKELVEPISDIKEGKQLKNRNRYQNIIPYDNNIVRLNKKIGKYQILADSSKLYFHQESLLLTT